MFAHVQAYALREKHKRNEGVAPVENNWHALSATACLDSFEISSAGLSEEQALLRREKYGANLLTEGRKVSLLTIFF
jgi:Ca2+-transporting ATPase